MNWQSIGLLSCPNVMTADAALSDESVAQIQATVGVKNTKPNFRTGADLSISAILELSIGSFRF